MLLCNGNPLPLFLDLTPIMPYPPINIEFFTPLQLFSILKTPYPLICKGRMQTIIVMSHQWFTSTTYRVLKSHRSLIGIIYMTSKLLQLDTWCTASWNHNPVKLYKGLSTNKFCHALNRFCLLSNPPSTPCSLKDTIKMERIPTKIRWKIHTFFTLYFKFWRYFKVFKFFAEAP